MRRRRDDRDRGQRLWGVAVTRVAMAPWWSPDQRGRILRRLGIDIGRGTLVQPCFMGSRRIRIGEWSYVGPGCRLDAREQITIGDRVALADEVMLVTSGHDHSDPALRAGARRDAPVSIGDGVWLGARVVVLPGVSVGDGCVVAAGAVVSRSCDPHGLYAGVPARRVRDLPTPGAT